ncbi:unnamed protein product [Candidula unifasciata]|uniref:WW domain-containing protein n=1 Tax=Candidula unifasciata TaxID=100452 RepID=A0A8S3YTV4_9EUPU|nr:unnamed protein product [Candidula unifasciata]
MSKESTRGSEARSSAVSSASSLPPELVQAGWGQFWSKREGRYYYFNKLTNESRWELPVIGMTHDPLTDPLRINTAACASEGLNDQASASLDSSLGQSGGDINPVMAALKRRACTQLFGGSSKRAHLGYKPFWNFEVPSNAVVRERAPLHLSPPHPDIEAFRYDQVMKLRQSYQELCLHQEGIDAPIDSLNRWLLERKVIDRGQDPVLPSDCTPEVSKSLVHEIMNDIPIKLIRPKLSEDARKLLFKYAEGAKRLVETKKVSLESVKIVKQNVEETFRWLRSRHNVSFEDYLERLTQLKRRCEPSIYEAAEASVESVVRRIYCLSVESCQKIGHKTSEVLRAHNIQEGSPVPEPLEPRLTQCSPVQLSIPSPRMPYVERVIEEEVVSLQYGGETLTINQEHFWKLEEIYGLNCQDDPRFDHFLARVWCLLKRYQAYFGSRPNEGKGNQGALSPALMETLHRVFNVSFECFASPFNCFFKQFCSAFPDTDGYFGSRGPFLRFCPTSGSFEANPPFSEELMEATVDHMESLLGETAEPLSFIVFIPDWRDPPTEALIRLESSRFKRKQFMCPPFEHEYRNGFQHLPSARKEMNCKAVFGTLVVFLQNEAGYAKWTPTAEKIKELVLASKT